MNNEATINQMGEKIKSNLLETAFVDTYYYHGLMFIWAVPENKNPSVEGLIQTIAHLDWTILLARLRLGQRS